MQRFVRIKTQHEFIHCWPEAPTSVYFLNTAHRHMLHLEVTVSVAHNDRDIEFIMLKREVDLWWQIYSKEWPIRTSCEDVCTKLIKYLQQQYGVDRSYAVAAYEDGENGAIISTEAGEEV